MNAHHVRNVIAILLVITFTNLVASFQTLRAAHTMRDELRGRLDHLINTHPAPQAPAVTRVTQDAAPAASAR